MIIVGEKINSTRGRVANAIENRDEPTIRALAVDQAEAGAHFIDVNAGTFQEREPECLCWLVETVQAAVDLPLCLDSPNPKALTEAIRLHRGEPMINSISLEKDRFETLRPVVASEPCHVVALCMAQTGMPVTVEERVAVGVELTEKLTASGVPVDRIYVDPLVQPVSVDIRMGIASLEAMREIMDRFPGVNTICGLSNISFGLPARKLVNRTFLAMAIAHGLNAAIADPLDRDLMAAILAGEMLCGRDEYCEDFIDAYQDGRIGGKG